MSNYYHFFRENLPPSGWVYRVLCFLAASFYLGALPYMVFALYMLEMRFFSYDFFVDGIVGMKTFFVLFSFIIVTFSGFSGLWLIELGLSKRSKKNGGEGWKIGDKWIGIFMFLIYLLLAIFLYCIESAAFYPFFIGGLLGLGLALYVGVAIAGKPKTQFMTLITIIFLSNFVMLQASSQIAYLVSGTLRAYGIGGGLDVTVSREQFEEEALEGTLLLSSPLNIYMRDFDGNVITLPRNRYDKVSIGSG